MAFVLRSGGRAEPRRAAASLVGALIMITALGVIAFAPGLARAGQFDSLPDNTWRIVTPQPTSRYICVAFVDCSRQRVSSQPVGRSYSGVSYGGGYLYYFGGGHASHPGNDIELYEIATNRWSQVYRPEGLPAVCFNPDGSLNVGAHPACVIAEGSITGALTPAGRPYVEHSYHQAVYDPSRRAFIAGYGGSTWAFDPVSRQLTRLNGTLPPSVNEIRRHMFYSPDLGTVLWMPLGANRGGTVGRFVFRLDRSNNWVVGRPFPDQLAYHDVYSAYDPTRHKHLVLTADGPELSMWWYDAPADQWAQIANVPSGLLGAHSVAYDSGNSVFLFAKDNGNDTLSLWTLDAADRWTRLSGTLPIVSTIGGHWDTLEYDPVNQVFWFLNARSVGGDGTGGINPGDVELLVYRYRKSDTPPEELPPGDPPPGDPPPGGGTFADVPIDHFAAPWIEALAAAGVTGGCASNPLRFCPETFVTREQMAVFLLKARHDAAYTPPACTQAPFGDVPCETPFAAWIADLVAHQTTAGCGGGDYCPTAPVTREQMAVFLLKILEGSEFVPAACTTEDFADVPCSSPFAPWVQELVRRGITVGCAAGRYCPTDPITRGQMAVFVVKTFGLPM